MKIRHSFLVLTLVAASCAVASRGRQEPAGHAAPSPQEVEWFRSNWYVGGSIGTAIATADDGDAEGDLINYGYEDAAASLDNSEFGWKLFGGYRFEAPFTVELGIVDLGMLESTVDGGSGDVDKFLYDVANVHPYSGAGISLTGSYFPIDTDRFQVGVLGGLWYWEAEVEAEAATGQSVKIDEDGIDLVVGLVGIYDINDRWSIRAEWERYFLDANDVDYLGLGVQYTVR